MWLCHSLSLPSSTPVANLFNTQRDEEAIIIISKICIWLLYYRQDKLFLCWCCCALLSFLSRTTHFRPCNVRSFTHFRLLPCSSCDKFNSRVPPMEETEKKKSTNWFLVPPSGWVSNMAMRNLQMSFFYSSHYNKRHYSLLLWDQIGDFLRLVFLFLFFENNFKIPNKFVLILFYIRRVKRIYDFQKIFLVLVLGSGFFLFLFAARVCGLLLIIKLSPSRQTDGGTCTPID